MPALLSERGLSITPIPKWKRQNLDGKLYSVRFQSLARAAIRRHPDTQLGEVLKRKLVPRISFSGLSIMSPLKQRSVASRDHGPTRQRKGYKGNEFHCGFMKEKSILLDPIIDSS